MILSAVGSITRLMLDHDVLVWGFVARLNKLCRSGMYLMIGDHSCLLGPRQNAGNRKLK